MRFKSRLIRGTLIQRYKRFLADVRLENDEIVTAHCTNTGSMMGCKEPGSPVYISRSENLNRKLLYTWELIKTDSTWVGINTLHPNKLVPEAVESGVIAELSGYPSIRREVKVSAHTRLDLCLEGTERKLLRRGEKRYPSDERHRRVSRRGQRTRHETFESTHAPQTPGPPRRHRFRYPTRRLRATFRPADEIDSEYGRWLRKAIKAGVEALPYRAKVTAREIVLTDRIATTL